jgi:hypothetical protein
VGHLLRIVLRVPLALFRGSARERIGAEARALGVLLGLGQPPLKAEPPARPANPSTTVLDEAR